jgi:hypothetical protein
MIASKRLQFATNVNTGISSSISGSETNVPNTGALRSISGLAFSNTTIRSFVVNVNVSIVRTTGGNLFETFTLEGNQRASSWDLYVTSLGDTTSTTFSITSAGQVQHTTAVVANWTSTSIIYSGTQFVANGTLTNVSSSTSGSCVVKSLQILDTTDVVNGTSNGALIVMGGVTVNKTLSALNINATSITGANLTVTGTLTATNITTSNISRSSGTLVITGDSNTIGSIITTGGNVGIGTTAPNTKLHVNGDMNVANLYLSQIPASLNAMFCQAAGSFSMNNNTITVLRSYNCTISYSTAVSSPTAAITRIVFGTTLSAQPVIASGFQRAGVDDFLNFFWPSTVDVYMSYHSGRVIVGTFAPVHFIVY